MKSTLSIICSLATVLFCGGAAVAQEPDNCPEIFTLPLPCGQKMDFVLVRVTDAENPFSSVSFQLGKDLHASYDERMSLSSVSGTVYVPAHDGRKAYWAIPMGRTEVTRAQYAAVMNPEQMPAEKDAQLPHTNVSYVEIQDFIAKLNAWCLSNSNSEAAKIMQELAGSRLHGTPYLRLPQENEWEFAARGAGFVSVEQLKEDIPYSSHDDLQQHENVYLEGNEKLRPVGYRQTTHPCGLCDMFGNAREIVDGVFRPEYHFGRTGGLIVRGGCYVDQYVSSYTRSEVAPFNKRGEAYRESSVGFRLAMGSAIVAGGMRGQRLENVWEQHVAKLVQVATPGSTPTDSLDKALEQERHNLALQLQEVTTQLAALTGGSGDVSEIRKLGNTLADMRDQLREMEKKVRQSQITSAQAALHMIYSSSADASENLANTIELRRRAQSPGISDLARETYLNNIKIREDNLPAYWATFTKGCMALKDVDPTVTEEQINARMQEIVAAGNVSEAKRAQIKVFQIAIKHFKKYVASGRLSQSECLEWYQEFEKL